MSRTALDDIAARATAAAATLWSDARVFDVTPLEGGHSGLTVAAQFAAEDVVRPVVIKLAPAGRPAVGRHDVLRQARVHRALAALPDVAVPAVVFETAGPPPLFAMERAPGEALEPLLDAPDVTRPATETARRARAAVTMLAALHRYEPAAVGLGDEAADDPLGELDRWVPVMEAIEPELRPRAAELEGALRADVPAPWPSRVLHGDFRLGNLLCDDGAVTAIIDWEIWSVGDPRADLAWMLAFCDTEDLPGISAPAAGMPTATELVAAYEEATGAAVTDLAWFDALARFKMAAVMGHNLRRHREGRHHDPYQERLPATILRLVDRGLDRLAG
jgi:aminoglycoside phosphotransferase (APT) family kinase protein